MSKVTMRAYQKYVRQTPRKLRLLADLVRNLTVDEALNQLKFSSKKGSIVMIKVLKQAKANAINFEMAKDSLAIKELVIEEGATYKRWNPVSRGRAHSIMKRTSHIKLVLEGEKGKEKEEGKKSKRGGKKTIKSTKRKLAGDLSKVGKVGNIRIGKNIKPERESKRLKLKNIRSEVSSKNKAVRKSGDK